MDSTTSRPRPRPRPRPLTKSSSTTDGPSSTPGASSSSTQIPLASSTSPGKKRVIEVIDTDEMFMRNTDRTYQTWQRLDQIDRKMSKIEKETTASSDDSDNGTPSPRRNRNKNKKVKQALPSWQRSQAMTRLLSKDISDNDSDDDVEFLGDSSTPNTKANGKRKRQERSRSRSITPPPSVPFHQIQNAKNLVRQALNINPRPPSPKFDPDDSTDTIVLLPELKAIAQEIKDKHLYSSLAPEAVVAGSGEHIVINVTWHPHPKALEAQKQDWQYRIDRSESFRDLFEAVAEDAGIPSANVVMTYQNNRFFPSITPLILKIWSDSAHLDAYEQTTWKYMQENQDTSRFTASQTATAAASTSTSTSYKTNGPIEIDSDSDNDDGVQVLGTSTTFGATTTSASSPSPTYTYTQPTESDAESEAEGGKFKLILRSSLTTKDITLTVRPTTKCGAIVKAFLNKAGLADKYHEVFAEGGVAAAAARAPEPAKKKGGRKAKRGAAAVAAAAVPVKDPRLCIDGDKMDNATEIGDMDLEDGDMVEVVGL
ncbi:hypothetical protein CPB84DRAFT_1793598 [Gymnopilus junonius]|uniref:Rad60/SUMO-like domain-containing protein n=1 Tax=Gymnopilus junonius TaxID=109634 RepID=A0A9P5NCB2_GYMJU|nr:hypothetical protein CPB84DRAFT_1793598 [Gymnopilus junonius]